MLFTPENRHENESDPNTHLLRTSASGSVGSLNYDYMSLQDFNDILQENQHDGPEDIRLILNSGFTSHHKSYHTFVNQLRDRLSYIGVPIEEAIKTLGIGLLLGVMAQINPRTVAKIMYISLYTDVGLQLLGLFLGCYAKYRPRSKSGWSRMIRLCLDLTRELLQGIAHANIIFLFVTEIFGDILGIAENFKESNDDFPALPYYFILGGFATLAITCASLLRLDYWHRTMPKFIKDDLTPMIRGYAPNLERFVRNFMKSKIRRIMTTFARWFTISNLLHATATVSIRGGYAFSGKPEALEFDFISEAIIFGSALTVGFGTTVLYESKRCRSFINYCLRLSPIYIFAVLMGLITKRVQEQGEYDLELFYILQGATVVLMLTAPTLLFLMHTCLRSCLGDRGYQRIASIQVDDDVYNPWTRDVDMYESDGDYGNDIGSTVSSMRYIDADAERLEQAHEGKEQKTKPVAAIEIETEAVMPIEQKRTGPTKTEPAKTTASQMSSVISNPSKGSKNSHSRVRSWTPGMFPNEDVSSMSGSNMQALGNVPNVSKDDIGVRYFRT